jgi:protein gp37
VTAIEWTEQTWNPVTGCSKISPGCAHCYAETLSLRWRFSQLPWTPANARENVLTHPERLAHPLRWRRPRLVFVNSMSDLFHEQVPGEFIERVFAAMNDAGRHTFQVLTKRPERMLGLVPTQPAPNVWLGVSIENRRYIGRADVLRATPAAVRFISAEPLLGPLDDLDLTRIDWLICGGESGPRHRTMRPEWAADLRDRCVAEGVAFFFKQDSGARPGQRGRFTDETEWPRQWPPIPGAG